MKTYALRIFKMNVVVGAVLFGVLTVVNCESPPWVPPPFEGQGDSGRVKRSSECYGDLGCFPNDYPFNNTDNALPLNPRFIRTNFQLLTTLNTRFPHELRRDSLQSLQRSRYDGSKPTIFIIHGFEQYGMVQWVVDMAKEFLKKGPTNVIIVDWGHGSGWPYTQAVANTRVVGAEVAKMVEFLMTKISGDLSKFHLIGHSLGAHVAGYAGERLQGRLGRITGLDPAEPNFKGTDTRVRLDQGDARFVDVLHTDGSAFDDISGYGLIDPMGHVDFYPNGGENQPGCVRETWRNVLSESYHSGIMRATDIMSCSHSRSILLYTESIKNDACQFRAFPCTSFNKYQQGECLSCGSTPCPVMGYHAFDTESYEKPPRGKYYLVTGKTEPFCGYTYGVELHLSSGMSPTEGMIVLSVNGNDGHQANHSFYSEEFTGGQVNRGLIWSPSHVSDISTVHVSFEESSKLWYWIWAGSVQLNMIAVTDSQTNERVLFCGNDVTISSGSSVVLSKTRSGCGSQAWIRHL